MRTLTSLALIALASSGCIVVHDNGNPPPPPPPQNTTPPTYRIAPRQPAVLTPGQQAGYAITANLGGSYRIEWTGQSPAGYNRFTGSIYTPGTFTDFNPGCGGACPLENGDIVNTPAPDSSGTGQVITFDTLATDGLDGTDFAVSLEPVEFDLVIDGVRYPNLVIFPDTDTGALDSPATIPFQLTSN